MIERDEDGREPDNGNAGFVLLTISMSAADADNWSQWYGFSYYYYLLLLRMMMIMMYPFYVSD